MTLELRILRTDGTVRHTVSHTRRERVADRQLVFGVVFDVTAQHRVEAELRSASERAALAARAVGLGTWEFELPARQARWDAQMWALRGLPPQLLAPGEEQRMASVHPEDRERVLQAQRAVEHSGAPLDQEFRVVWPDGRLRWLASRSIELGAGGQRRRIGVNWDITEQRSAQAARQEREIAQRESVAKSKFLARMSHELRTPLNAVLGFSQLLLQDERGADAPAAERRRRLDHIRAAGEHLLSLINDVLDLSSLEGGELRIELQAVALAPLVTQTLALLGPQLDSRGVRVRTGPLDISVMADATRLRQVLLNLLSNAIKYNREGGEVRVEALPRGSTVLLRVVDSGQGMSDEQLLHHFEPFNRLGRDEKGDEAVEGTGIGLAIVKALVERMGGSVHVDSIAGVGSVFELRLQVMSVPAPAPGTDLPAAATPLEPPGAAPAPAAAPRRRQLLYVEDNPVNALIISELLSRRSDVALHLAVDGSSGVAQAQALRPDLVLLDMQLPDFDGFEVLRRLRAEPATAAIPCIALSANAMPEDIQRALRAGMQAYWTKPLDFKAFMTSIDALLDELP